MRGRLTPIMRIGERTAPARGLAVCEQLGALVTAHIDGRLLVGCCVACVGCGQGPCAWAAVCHAQVAALGLGWGCRRARDVPRPRRPPPRRPQIRSLPHPKSPAGLTYQYVERQIAEIKNRSMPFAEIQASK